MAASLWPREGSVVYEQNARGSLNDAHVVGMTYKDSNFSRAQNLIRAGVSNFHTVILVFVGPHKAKR